MAFNPSIDVNSWKTIQWSASVPNLDVQLTELMLKLSTWCTNVGQVLAAPAASVADSAVASVISQRTRGYSSIGNSTFEVDQRNCHTQLNSVAAGGVFVCDRWSWVQPASATYRANVASALTATNSGTAIPGTNFFITDANFKLNVATVQATLAAGDYGILSQNVEGPAWRELAGDVHSISLLVYSGVPLHFSVFIRDSPATKTFVHLCLVPVGGVWTLITIPGIPVFPAGNFTNAVGSVGYQFGLCFGAGSTFTAPSADTWVSGAYLAAPGTDNFFSNPVNTAFFCAFIQHEPGNICTAPIDKPFSGAYDEALRFYCKSYDYGTLAGTGGSPNGCLNYSVNAANLSGGQIYAPFPKPMAKVPTGTSYAMDGTVNAVNDVTAGANKSVTLFTSNSRSIQSVGLGTASTSGALLRGHYTADTGW